MGLQTLVPRRAQHPIQAGGTVLRGLVLPVVIGLSGCAWFSTIKAPLASPAPLPSAPEVVAELNRHAQQVQSIEATKVDLSVWDHWRPFSLDGRLEAQQPMNFRLQARAFGTLQADIGSNDRGYWFYIKQAPGYNGRPTVYYTPYDATALAQSPVPFQPEWVMEALGLRPIAPRADDRIEPDKPGFLKLVTQRQSPQGQPVIKETIIDRKSMTPLEHRLLDAQGKTLVKAAVIRFQQNNQLGLPIPKIIEIGWPDKKLVLRIDMKLVTVNPPLADVALWTLPHIQDAQVFDLARQTVISPPDGPVAASATSDTERDSLLQFDESTTPAAPPAGSSAPGPVARPSGYDRPHPWPNAPAPVYTPAASLGAPAGPDPYPDPVALDSPRVAGPGSIDPSTPSSAGPVPHVIIGTIQPSQ